MRCRPQLVEKFFPSNPESVIGKSTDQIRAMGIDDRALLWGLGSGSDERTLDLGDNSNFYQGVATTKWNNNYSDGNTPHDSYDADGDFFLFRAAEAYLNAAEAALHLNQADKAKTYVDAIRNRAHAVTSTSYDLQYILDERAREFYFEGLRRPDLIRYNQFGGLQATYGWQYKGGSNSYTGANFEKTRNVYPLPQSEVDANTNLTQIEGY
jgi:hypothetical protein